MSTYIKSGTITSVAKKLANVTRINKNASKMITDKVEAYAITLSSAAREAASHAGRTTVQEADVQFVIDNLSKFNNNF